MDQLEDIVQSVREIREAYARRFNYDLDAIPCDLVEYQEQLRAEGWKIVNLQPRHPETVQAPDESPEPVAAP